jgi:hypothetical protein
MSPTPIPEPGEEELLTVIVVADVELTDAANVPRLSVFNQ